MLEVEKREIAARAFVDVADAGRNELQDEGPNLEIRRA